MGNEVSTSDELVSRLVDVYGKEGNQVFGWGERNIGLGAMILNDYLTS